MTNTAQLGANTSLRVFKDYWFGLQSVRILFKKKEGFRIWQEQNVFHWQPMSSTSMAGCTTHCFTEAHAELVLTTVQVGSNFASHIC